MYDLVICINRIYEAIKPIKGASGRQVSFLNNLAEVWLNSGTDGVSPYLILNGASAANKRYSRFLPRGESAFECPGPALSGGGRGSEKGVARVD